MGDKKFIFIFLVLFFLAIFGSKISPEVPVARALEIEYPTVPGAETPNTKPLLPNYVKYIFNLSLLVASLIALASFIYGGARYIFSAGSPFAMADAKDQITAAFLGLIILLCAWYVLATVNPQLIILKLPGLPTIPSVPISQPTPSPLGPAVSKFQEIPVGTLITSEGQYPGLQSDYEGFLDKERLERMLTLADTTQKATDALKDLNAILKALTDLCKCSNTLTGGCSVGGCYNSCTFTAQCNADPCPNRTDINAKRNEISLLAGAFEAFLKKDGIVRTYLNNNDLALRTAFCTNPNDLATCSYYFYLVIEMRNVEEDTGGFEENLNNSDNKTDFKSNLDKLERAEWEIKKCYPQSISYNEYQTLRVSQEVKVETVKNIAEFQNIDIGEDPATFYCVTQ